MSATLRQCVEIQLRYLLRRSGRAGRVPDLEASRSRPIVHWLKRALAPMRAQNPGYAMSVTRLSAFVTSSSALMIERRF